MSTDDLRHGLRNMRHLYEQMLDGRVVDCAGAARGLLGPAIEGVERADAERNALRLEVDRLTKERDEARDVNGWTGWASSVRHRVEQAKIIAALTIERDDLAKRLEASEAKHDSAGYRRLIALENEVVAEARLIRDVAAKYAGDAPNDFELFPLVAAIDALLAAEAKP